MQKRIEHVLLGRPKQITPDETVRQSLPNKDFRFANPFIVLHHLGPEEIAPGGQARIAPHPHRGFAPVTFQLQGEGYHMDSAGNSGYIYAGDVQWMFAGKGLLHSEGPTEQLLTYGGTNELIQLWVNVPAAHKWDEPFYQQAPKENLPGVLQQEGVNLRLASGSYDSKQGPLKSFTPVITIIGEISKGATVNFPATPGYWTLVYIIKGSITVDNRSIPQYNLLVFEKDNDEITVTAREDSQILFLSAEPINEPVAAKDNFVMNTSDEIDQAFEDYKKGIFGTLSH